MKIILLMVAIKAGNLEFDNLGKKKPVVLYKNFGKAWNYFNLIF